MFENKENRLKEIKGYILDVDDSSFYTLLGVMQTGLALFKDIETFLTSYNISHGRFEILLVLYKHMGNGLLASELSLELDKKKPTISGLLKKLLEEDLVEEDAVSEDQRKKPLRLSSKGFKLLEKIIPVYNKRIIAIAQNLDEVEKKLLDRLIAKIII